MIPKFRTWDKTIYRMCELISINFKDESVVYKDWEYGISEEISFGDVELLQSTGLFDKKGKEIYEGDIVDVSTVGGRFYLRGIVKKVKGGFYIEKLNRSNVTPLTDFYFKGYTNTLEIKIIGNIYQDKDLLEEE